MLTTLAEGRRTRADLALYAASDNHQRLWEHLYADLDMRVSHRTAHVAVGLSARGVAASCGRVTAQTHVATGGQVRLIEGEIAVVTIPVGFDEEEGIVDVLNEVDPGLAEPVLRLALRLVQEAADGSPFETFADAVATAERLAA